MLFNVDLPKFFWVEAVATTVHVINRLPNKKLNLKVTKEIWSRKPPSYKHLRVFDCELPCFKASLRQVGTKFKEMYLS